MVVGYLLADASKRAEVLKIVATVLDFNEDERSKTGLGQSASQGWLRGWFGGSSAGGTGQSGIGHRRTTSGEVQSATGLDLGIAQAFVRFLETESKPKAPPLQMPTEMTTIDRSPSGTESRKSSERSTPTALGQMSTTSAFNPTSTMVAGEVNNPLFGAALNSQVI